MMPPTTTGVTWTRPVLGSENIHLGAMRGQLRADRRPALSAVAVRPMTSRAAILESDLARIGILRRKREGEKESGENRAHKVVLDNTTATGDRPSARR